MGYIYPEPPPEGVGSYISQWTEPVTNASSGEAVIHMSRHLETLTERHCRESNRHADCAELCLDLDDDRGFRLHAELADLHAACARATEFFTAVLAGWPREP